LSEHGGAAATRCRHSRGLLIRFKHPDFEGIPGSYTLQREPRSGNELHTATFVGTDAVAVLAAYKTSAGYVMESIRIRWTEQPILL
jgi:hypothetical protein